jgi:hypothetical protein
VAAKLCRALTVFAQQITTRDVRNAERLSQKARLSPFASAWRPQ